MAQIKDKAKQIQKLKSMGQYGSSVPSSGKKEAFVNLQRQKFFGDRKDVPEERVIRRTRQEGGVDQFKQSLISSGRVLKDSKGNTVMNPNTGEPIYLTDVPGGRTVGDVSRDFAYRFGPTFKEIGSDIGYGIRSIGSALGERIASGNFGIMGIAKGLFEKFSNAVSASKKAIGDQVNKLSDIDLEILKNKDKYKFTSKKPNLANIDQLEANAKQAAANRDYFGTYFSYGGPSMPGEVERQTIKPIIPSTLYGMPQQPPGFKVMPPEQKALLDEMNKADALNSAGINNIQIQNGQGSVITDQQMNDAINKSNEIFGNDSFFGTSSTYNPNEVGSSDLSSAVSFAYPGNKFGSTAVPNNIQQARTVEELKNALNVPVPEYWNKEKPYLQEQDDYYYQDKERYSPQGNQYLYAANGGAVDQKLNNLQKKTNNIYGTGILSVR